VGSTLTFRREKGGQSLAIGKSMLDTLLGLRREIVRIRKPVVGDKIKSRTGKRRQKDNCIHESRLKRHEEPLRKTDTYGLKTNRKKYRGKREGPKLSGSNEIRVGGVERREVLSHSGRLRGDRNSTVPWTRVKKKWARQILSCPWKAGQGRGSVTSNSEGRVVRRAGRSRCKCELRGR